MTGPADQAVELAGRQAVAREGPVDRHDVAGLRPVDERAAIAPGLDALRPGRAEREPSVAELDRHDGDDEEVTVALDDAAPPDPARIDRLEDRVERSRAQEADPREHVEDMERVNGHGPAARLGPEPAPAVGAQTRPEATRQRAREGLRAHRVQQGVAQPV